MPSFRRPSNRARAEKPGLRDWGRSRTSTTRVTPCSRRVATSWGSVRPAYPTVNSSIRGCIVACEGPVQKDPSSVTADIASPGDCARPWNPYTRPLGPVHRKEIRPRMWCLEPTRVTTPPPR